MVIFEHDETFRVFNAPVIELSACCETDDNYDDDVEVVFPEPPKSLIEEYESYIKETAIQAEEAKRRYRLEIGAFGWPRVLALPRLIAMSIDLRIFNEIAAL